MRFTQLAAGAYTWHHVLDVLDGCRPCTGFSTSDSLAHALPDVR